MRCSDLVRRLCLSAIFLALALGAPVLGSNYGDGEGYTGVKLGLIGSGSLDIERFNGDHEAAAVAGIFFDFPFGSRFHYGLSADFITMNWKVGDGDFALSDEEFLIDLGINAKFTLSGEESAIILRPGAGIGFGVLRKMESLGISGSNYFTARAFVELAFPAGADLMAVIDGGIWYAPSGGDDNFDISIGPLVFIRGGLMF